MLVLSRQRDETIMIGDDTEVTVVDIRGDKVRLGTRAPGHDIHRKEIFEEFSSLKKAFDEHDACLTLDIIEQDYDHLRGIFKRFNEAAKSNDGHLVLSRERDETIMIGDEVEVTVVDIRGDKVRLGINAPRTIPVHRKEVYEAIRRENEGRQHTTKSSPPPGTTLET